MLVEGIDPRVEISFHGCNSDTIDDNLHIPFPGFKDIAVVAMTKRFSTTLKDEFRDVFKKPRVELQCCSNVRSE